MLAWVEISGTCNKACNAFREVLLPLAFLAFVPPLRQKASNVMIRYCAQFWPAKGVRADVGACKLCLNFGLEALLTLNSRH